MANLAGEFGLDRLGNGAPAGRDRTEGRSVSSLRPLASAVECVHPTVSTARGLLARQPPSRNHEHLFGGVPMPLRCHFLNVGHGDCTIIEHPSGRLTMIDVNNSKSLPKTDEIALAEAKGLSVPVFKGIGIALSSGNRSWADYYRSLLVDPFDYYVDHFGGRDIWRYIQSHPDMDHMSGLCRFFWQENVGLLCMWDTAHEKDFDEGKFDKSRFDWNDWLMYKWLRSGKRKDESEMKVLQNLGGETGWAWSDDEITILAPTDDLVDYANRTENWNNLSYVLRVEHAGRSIILPGDAEKPIWDKLEELHGSDLKCDVLKASHHGRESGYSESATDQMKPEVVICSVGNKPDTDASDEYKSHGARVLSTRFYGTITATIEDNGSIVVRDRNDETIEQL
jgi:competence protein ComEC